MVYECTWLKQPREDANMGQKALLDVVGITDVNHIGRWERCEKRVPKKHFAKLAECFGMDDSTLYEHYHRDWAAMHPDESGVGTDDKQQPKVDTRSLQSLLNRVKSERFLALLLDNTQTSSVNAAVQVLASHIQQDQITTLQLTLTGVISDFCEQATVDDVDSLLVLRDLYRVVLLTCAVPLPGLATVANNGTKQSHHVSGAKAAHTLIFAIDRTLNLKGYKRLEIKSKDEINDHRKSTLCIQLSDTGADDAAEWAHNFVAQVGETLGLEDHCPRWNQPNNQQAFKDYCFKLNNALGARNLDKDYLFARFDEPVPPAVFDYIDAWLGNLHLFECEDSGTASCNIMRGDPGVLGAWMAQGETAINTLLEDLRADTPDVADELPVEGKAPKRKGFWKSAVEGSEDASTISKNAQRIVRHWWPSWSKEDD